jgi:signal recognition particle receptor subunit beta
MFFVWSQKRINVKLAWWGPPEAGKTTTIHALAADIARRAEAADASERAWRGMPRNTEPVEIDEPDTRFTTYFCHPPDEIGLFSGWPLHYQCKTPEQPLEDNLALDKVLDGISAVVFVADAMRERQAANEEALRDLVGRLGARHDIGPGTLAARVDALFGPGGPLRLVLQVNKVDQLGALPGQRVRRGLLLGASVPTVETVATEGEGIWETFEAAAEAIRPLLEAAQKRGRIPAAPTPE